MSFFERQDAARTSSLRLVVLFIAAVLGIVLAVDIVVVVLAHSQPSSTLVSLLSAVSIVTLLIIAGGSVTKTISLRAGGSALAESVGAVAVDPTTSDPVLRRYINVVEEMSLASGVPMPRLFVLREEAGINAFAAGYTPADAAITVTGGALDRLNRAELQGVIGHEFSHILNGDMRLNIRLIGLLNGILLLGLVGLRVLSTGGRSRDKNAGPILLVALAMMILGFVGQFFAGLIKAAVSRQREWLADASSVQFTRDPVGLEGALKKIAGLPSGSALTNARNAKEVSHMLFGEGSSRIGRLYATHPPLLERIKALDPSFDPAQLAELEQRWSQHPPVGLAEDAQLGFAGPTPVPTEAVPTRIAVAPGAVSSRVGSLTPTDLERGSRLSAQIPAGIRQLANQQSTAVPFVLALLLNQEPPIRARQLELIAARLGPEAAQATGRLAAEAAGLPRLLRLPTVSIAIPLLTHRPRRDLDLLLHTLGDLALADESITVFEYSLTRMVGGYVEDSLNPSRRSRPGKASVRAAQQAAFTVLAAIAGAGNDDPDLAERAFRHAAEYLLPGSAVSYRPPSGSAQLWAALDAAWKPLDALDPKHKQRFIEAAVVAVRDDAVIGVDEAELLRTTCGLLHCSLPTFIS